MLKNYQKFIPLVILILAAGAFLFWQNQEKTILTPDLDRTVEISASLTDEQKSQAVVEIERLSEELKANPENAQNLLGLASWRALIGDFEAAENIWLYLIQKNPSEPTAYLALGEFYHLVLRDYEKSEIYLRQAIELEPTNLQGYFDLYELYRYSYPDKTQKAPEVLLLGLEKNPDNLNLLFTLAQYYEESGDKDQAREYYLSARLVAQKAGDEKTLKRLDEILKNL